MPGSGGLAGLLAPLRRADLTVEFVQLHYAIEALRGDDPVVLQFLSATPGEGTSTVVAGYAAVVAAERAGILVVDCGGASTAPAGAASGVPARSSHAGGGPAGDDDAGPTAAKCLIGLTLSGLPPDLAVHQDPSCPGLARARLGFTDHPLIEIGTAELRGLLAALGELYPTVVLDCPAAANSPDSVALSRHCDGTVLVVRAAVAKAVDVIQTRVAIERAGGHVTGVVLNRRKRPLPAWLTRRR